MWQLLSANTKNEEINRWIIHLNSKRFSPDALKMTVYQIDHWSVDWIIQFQTKRFGMQVQALKKIRFQIRIKSLFFKNLYLFNESHWVFLFFFLFIFDSNVPTKTNKLKNIEESCRWAFDMANYLVSLGRTIDLKERAF